MGVIDGQILWLAYHQQRLISHAEALQLDLDSHSVMAIIRTHAEQLQQGMLKLMVTRAVQDVRGYGYVPTASGSACEIWLKSSAMTVTTTEQLRLPDGCLIPMQPISSAICLSSQLACLPPLLAGLKSLNRLDNVLASGELQSIKAQVSEDNIKPSISEGLLRDMSGRWVEGTMSNVFYQLSDSPLSTLSSEKTASEKLSTLPLYEDNANYLTTGQWYTPSMAQSGVAGVMRQVLINALSTSKHPVIIRSLKDEDLPRLSQLFFCNALRGLMPMSSLTLLSGEVVRF
jgi:4-amino-4-deoxychorismate lyase